MTRDEGELLGGRYRLLRALPGGAMGEVWLAEDERLARRVVVKRTDAPDEGRILARMHHPHVVALHEVLAEPGPEGEEFWLVMEHLPLTSLAAVLAGTSEGRLPEEEGTPAWRRAAEIGLQLARALQAVHARGVVHGDLKPGNVLVGEDWFVKLGDFGISGAGGDPEETLEGGDRTPCTPAYAAPEVQRGARPSRAADVFALGATLFALTEGRSVYGPLAAPPHELVARARVGRVAAAGRAGPLAPVLARLLAPEDPAARPDAAQARRLLEGVLRGRRRRWAPVAAAAAGAAALVVTGALLWLPGGGGGGAGGGEETEAPEPEAGREADPCALAATAELRAFGDTLLDTDYGNFDRCDVILTTDRGEEVDVMVDLNSAPAPEPASPTERLGEVRLVGEPPGDEECTRLLLLPDTTWINVRAAHWDGGSPDLCAIADRAAEHAAGVVDEAGGVPARRAAFPEGSLAAENACALLPASVLAEVVPGTGADDTDVGFGDWSCEWYSTVTETEVELVFDRADPITAEDGVPARFSGFDAAVGAGADGPGTCVALLEYRSYPAEDGGTGHEKLALTVSGPGEGETEERCAAARELMAVAAAGLPRA